MDSVLWSPAKARLIYTDDDGVAHNISLWKERHAVIEAAKAWRRWQWKNPHRSAYAPEGWDERLANAVQALEGAEEGKE